MKLTRDHMRSLIERYFAGCNAADIAAMTACFVPGAVHYFPAGSPAFAPGPFVGADVIAQRWADAMASDPADVAQVQHETLLIHGREDQVVPLSASVEIFGLLPNAQLHVFGRCGHWTQLEYADQFSGSSPTSSPRHAE